MEELTDDAKKMLDALKTDETPSKTSSERMWAAVAAGGATAALAGGIGKGKLLLFAAFGITAIGALVVLTQLDEQGGTATRGEATAVASTGEPARPDPEPAVVPPAPEEEPAVEDAPPIEPDAAEGSPSERPEPKPATKEAPSADDLERELELIGQAKSALRGGDAKETLRILSEHKTDFPRSSFGEERAFLKMTALCDLGQKKQARREAERFLKKHPKSALTPRVETLCTEP